MRTACIVALCLGASSACWAAGFVYAENPQSLDLTYQGKTWLSTVIIPFNPQRAEETYKVYTHIYDFAGGAPITKGVGGHYTHHRGMFIGWCDTKVNGVAFDAWGMSNCQQQHVAWLKLEGADDHATQVEDIQWVAREGAPFIKEVRTITARPGENGQRVFDFQSELTSLAGKIQLNGDLHHAGMQVRMDNEVDEHPDTTQYILPAGATESEGNEVKAAWWACCSPVVRGVRYWILHMTPPDHPTGVPVYSIRPYARFGAFFQAELAEGKPLTVRFRVLVSEKELNQAACQALYDAFAGAGKS